MSERKGTKALELWCKRLVKEFPDVQIDNMTTSWRNGIAFCALVHHFRPDLIDLSKLKPENVYENNQLAFSVAEKHLGIPALLDPEDMVDNDVPDRLSILTYLSQFYQRLGHTVNTKATSEVDSKSPSTSVLNTTPLFGKSGLDKCAACALPVYLAQRLMVAHKLYHRRCFRCSKCSGHLNPKNFEISDGSEFTCDSCKNEKSLTKFLNNNGRDQMGMLAFSDDMKEVTKEESINLKSRARPLSILEKINMFEKNAERDVVTDKVGNLHLKDNTNNLDISAPTPVIQASELSNDFNVQAQTETTSSKDFDSKDILQESDKFSPEQLPSKEYKSSINKFNFLQTQLADDVLYDEITTDPAVPPSTEGNIENGSQKMDIGDVVIKQVENENCDAQKREENITDDIRLAIGHDIFPTVNDTPSEKVVTPKHEQEPEIGISVPPRRKKHLSSPNKVLFTKPKKENIKPPIKDYPDHLNPFSDNEEEEDTVHDPSRKNSTNPFGSSDEEDDDLPPRNVPPGAPGGANIQQPTPGKRLIKAFNPFWSDDEEPSTDDEDQQKDRMYKSSLATSTPNLPADTPRRKKAKAPPPPVIRVSGTPLDQPCTSMDDVASISSLSSFNSTLHSDQKSYGVSTPLMKKKRPAPTPPDSLSTVSGGAGSLEKDVDTSGIHSNISDSGRRAKGPAPGLPLPERRAVKLAMTPQQLQAQLDLLETQQLGLERQGVLIEQMIRDKCEGDEPSLVPQEEVEDLVIQLCELVNEKNDLFRKQTELMYIRRQQRLEQEQADIEHEIRIIQSRPAVNRIDADKAREEQLVSRLVQVVRLRDELVQQLDCERRRERQEDRAIAVCIANKRAQRNSESNSSSMKSVEVVPTPKKNKVKDKVKKQLKKAKHTLYSKKKEDGPDKKEEKAEKEKKAK